MKKSPEELEKLRTAIEATVAAHRQAWRVAAPGKYEYEVAAAMQAVYLSRGCERDSYSPIVGSGPNSIYLHYDHNDRKMDRGEVLLMDVGAECAGYAADVTRTIPVSGKFTSRQREIYEVVLGAQKAAIAAVRPGATLGRTTPNSIHQAALDYMNSHGQDQHGQPLGKYFTHGIGHSVGLEVHDAYETGAPLEEGMVITVEPGLYLAEENIGIRIEDMVLVTKDGGQVLTSALPREAGDIEKALAK
jgi:Xaa-Pro aminopeptidase